MHQRKVLPLWLINLMRWLKKWCCSPIHFKFTDKISKFGSSWYHAVENYGNEIHYGKVMVNNSYLDELPQTGLLLSQQFGLGRPTIGFLAKPISSDNVFELQYDMGNLRHFPSTSYRRFGQFVREEHSLSRDWLVQLWLAQKREKDARRRRKQRIVHHVARRDPMSETLSSFQLAFRRFFLSQPAANEHKSQVKKTINQPPVNQYGGGSLSPSSSEEVKLAPLLSRSNLVITRDIEWANLMFAFEQENRYAIVDACYPQSPVGFISEKSNIIFRQLLRTRRPFIAYITDAMGNEIFRVRRPFWLINSTIYAEIDGKEIGVVHRRWHLWRRIYDLYLGKKQFAVVENPGFWNWTFTLKDNDENVLAEVNRDWRGVGFELFTDAGQYVIRFGDADSSFKSPAIEELEVSRPLTLSERAVAVALAVSLDNDYFSRRGGWGFPIMIAGE